MGTKLVTRAILCGLALVAELAAARLTEIHVTAVEPFADGMAFGAAGAYERVKGTFKGELDPSDPRNKVIVNLDKAQKNAAGRIEYEADFYILRPVDAAHGSRKILYDVTNRGRQYAHWMFGDARTVRNDPSAAEDAGNGLILRRGYVIVWSGWDPDAPRANAGLAMKPVIAMNGTVPIAHVIRDELMSGGRGPLRKTFRLTYEAATLEQSQARLTVRRAETDPRREIPADGWAYVNAREIRLLPEGTAPEPGSLYEFHYPAKNPRVLGHRPRRRRATSSRSCVTKPPTRKATPTRRGRASGTPSHLDARKAGATSAITLRSASTRTNPGARCSTASWRTPRAWAASFSITNSGSPRAPIPSTRTTCSRRTPSPSRPRARPIP